MTNREHYREQIIDICAKGERPIINADRLASCSSHDCSGCPNWYKSQNFLGQAFPAKRRRISRNGWNRNTSRWLTGRKCR